MIVMIQIDVFHWIVESQNQLIITPLMTRIAGCWQNQLKPLTNHFAEEGWSGAGRQVDANEVDWCTRQCHCNSHQRVDGITVEGNHYEENAAQAVDYWEEQRQLQGAETGRWQGQREKKGEAEKRNGRWEQWEEKKKGRKVKTLNHINKYSIRSTHTADDLIVALIALKLLSQYAMQSMLELENLINQYIRFKTSLAF